MGWVRDKAIELGCDVSNLMGPAWEGYYTFLVGPDGSKDGHDESNKGDERRDQFVDWLTQRQCDYGKSSYCRFAWVEVQYGDEAGQAIVIRHRDDEERERRSLEAWNAMQDKS